MSSRKFSRSREDRGAVVTVTIDAATSRFALVIDPAKPEPHFWKFPGGKIDEEDVDPAEPQNAVIMAANAAKRETKQETGVSVRLVALAPLPKRTHTLYPFIGLGDFRELASTGDEGERVKAFSLEQIYALKNFFPNHKSIMDTSLAHLGQPVREWPE